MRHYRRLRSHGHSIKDICVCYRRVYRALRISIKPQVPSTSHHPTSSPLGATGLASVLSVMEIAHTHYWAKIIPDPATLAAGGGSAMERLLGTPSASMQDLRLTSPTSPPPED